MNLNLIIMDYPGRSIDNSIDVCYNFNHVGSSTFVDMG